MNTDRQNISYEFDQATQSLGVQLWALPCQRIYFCDDSGEITIGPSDHFCQIGLRVRDWKRVIEQGTNNSLNMVEDVLWLEKKLKLRKAEER